MEKVKLNKQSQLRCVCCGKKLLEGVYGKHTEDIQCDRCGTSHKVEMERIEMTILYDTTEYCELER